MTVHTSSKHLRPADVSARSFGVGGQLCHGRVLPILAAQLLCLGMGCGKQAPQKPVYPMWDALQSFQSTEVMMPVDLAYNNDDMATFKKAIDSDTFKTALATFESSAIPSQFDSASRRQAKAEAVAQFRKSVELAVGGASKEAIQPSYSAAQKALAELRAPVGK